MIPITIKVVIIFSPPIFDCYHVNPRLYSKLEFTFFIVISPLIFLCHGRPPDPPPLPSFVLSLTLLVPARFTPFRSLAPLPPVLALLRRLPPRAARRRLRLSSPVLSLGQSLALVLLHIKKSETPCTHASHIKKCPRRRAHPFLMYIKLDL